MRTVSRRVAWAAGVVGLAVLLVLTAGALLRPHGGDAASRPATGRAGTLHHPGPGQDLGVAIAKAQQRLRTVPGDWPTWADLGMAYVQQARITADPSYYPLAEGASHRSLAIHPNGNAPAETGLGALQAARHDFGGALRYGKAAAAIDPYSAVAQGVVGDSLIELGRYDEAYAAIQRMVDLRPDTSSYSRASYAWELRGDIPRAKDALERALEVAPTGDDAGFALYYLGELAFNAGDLATAQARYDEGLRRAPDYPPLLAGTAKVLAAGGRTEDAVAAYRTVTSRLPQPAYVIEFGDLLAATGNREGAAEQYGLVRAQQQLLSRGGVDVDLELSLFDADHGGPRPALAEASATYRKRQSILAADALAWALHVNGRDAEALPHAREAVRIGMRNASLYYHLGMIENSLGQRDAAREHLELALKINPYFSAAHAATARAALTELGGAR